MVAPCDVTVGHNYVNMDKSKTQQNEVTVLRKLREEIGISQEGLAYKIGCSIRTIQRAENGDREPQFTAEQWINFQLFLKSHKKKLPRRLSDKVAV